MADELLSARQSAISMNRRVMMRFFMQNGTFSAFQSYVQQTNAALQTNAWEPLSKVVRLSEAVAVHPSTVFSSIPCNALVGTNGSPVVPQVLGTVAEIRQFAFLPDGSLDLPTTSDWCLTLVRSAPPSTSNSPLPSNFITIQLNHSGRIKVFRP